MSERYARVLEALDAGCETMSEIAEAIGRSRAAAFFTLRELEELGAIVREREATFVTGRGRPTHRYRVRKVGEPQTTPQTHRNDRLPALRSAALTALARGPMRTRELRQEIGVTPREIGDVLRTLAQAGLVAREGERRRFRYRLAEPAHA
jgi:predicted transcriptional regulator